MRITRVSLHLVCVCVCFEIMTRRESMRILKREKRSIEDSEHALTQHANEIRKKIKDTSKVLQKRYVVDTSCCCCRESVRCEKKKRHSRPTNSIQHTFENAYTHTHTHTAGHVLQKEEEKKKKYKLKECTNFFS